MQLLRDTLGTVAGWGQEQRAARRPSLRAPRSASSWWPGSLGSGAREDHLHPHRRGAGARDRSRCCRSCGRSPAPPGSRSSCATSRSPGRILAQFPDRLDPTTAARRRAERARRARADSGGEHHQAAEHQRLGAAAQGRDRRAPGRTATSIPDYPEEPADDEQREIRARYDRVKGSAVNPVLRQGNSDRRAPASVKAYARRHPHSMGAWSPESRSHVATMSDGDFRSTERVGDTRRRRARADRARRGPTARSPC